MSADGSWSIIMKTPLGSQAATLHLSTTDGTLTGALESRLGSGALANGKVDGPSLMWTVALKFPIPVTAEFHATIEGATISGYAKLGPTGKAPFKGQRTNNPE